MLKSITRKINISTIHNVALQHIVNMIDNCIDPIIPSQKRMVGRIAVSNNLANIPVSNHMMSLNIGSGNLLDPYHTQMLYIDPMNIKKSHSHLTAINNEILVSQPFLEMYSNIFKYAEETSVLTINKSLDITFMVTKYTYKDEISSILQHEDEEPYVSEYSSLRMPIMMIDSENIKPVMCNVYNNEDESCVSKHCLFQNEGFLHDYNTTHSIIKPPLLIDHTKEGYLTFIEANIHSI